MNFKPTPGLRTLAIRRKVKDWPYNEIVPRMGRLQAEGKAILVKYTCSHCGIRAMGKPNDWSPIQTCPACGKEHDFEKSGGNYAISDLLNPDGEFKTSFDAAVAFRAAQTENK